MGGEHVTVFTETGIAVILHVFLSLDEDEIENISLILEDEDDHGVVSLLNTLVAKYPELQIITSKLLFDGFEVENIEMSRDELELEDENGGRLGTSNFGLRIFMFKSGEDDEPQSEQDIFEDDNDKEPN